MGTNPRPSTPRISRVCNLRMIHSLPAKPGSSLTAFRFNTRWPLDEIALGIESQNLQADAQSLNLGPVFPQVLARSFAHDRNDGLLASVHFRQRCRQFGRRAAALALEEVRSAGDGIP